MKSTSLRRRVSSLVTIIVVVTAGLNFLAAHWSLQISLSDYVRTAKRDQVADWASVLTLVQDEGHSLNTGMLAFPRSTVRIDGKSLMETQFALATRRRTIVHTSFPRSVWRTWPASGVLYHGKSVGVLYMQPYVPTRVGPIRRRISGNFDLGLALVTLLSTLGALALTTLVIRRALMPLSQLALATNAIVKGNFNASLPTGGDDELRQLVASFSAMRENLNQARDAREQALADIHHELRTPMNVISNRLEAIQVDLFQWDHQTVSVLHREVQRIQKILLDLRELQDVITDALTLAPEWIDVLAWLNDLASLFQVECETSDVLITLCTQSSPIRMWADANKMSQVMVNLISNALRFTPRGRNVRILASEDACYVHLEVRDEGQGIAPEHLPHIFERFYRVDESRDPSSGGSGLGLSIVHEIIRAHRGTVTVESEVGSGTRFLIRLPKSPEPCLD